MKLYYSERSPYARKVRAVAAEKAVSLRLVEVMPLELPADLVAKNPLSKVPVLITEEGEAIYDSPVICEYLDAVGQGEALMPSSGLARVQEQTRVALVDGIIDAAVNCMYESMRPAAHIWQGYYDKHKAVVLRGIQACDASPAWLKSPSLAAIGLACALDYIDHRVSAVVGPVPWRDECPHLAQWFESFRMKDSITTTAPASWERATRAA